jgi:hypothetical protein
MKKNLRKGQSLPALAACAATCLWGGTSAVWGEDAQPAAEAKPAAEEKPKTEEKAEEKKDDSATTETELRNWFDVSVGGNLIRGNAAQFMERQQLPKGAYGGVSDFHYEQDLGKKGLFEVDGRGIFDNHDYSFRLNAQHPDYGFLRFGLREYRTWYNGSGGYLPVNDTMIHLYNEEFALDRGEFWFEGGLTLPGKPVLTFRYNHLFRQGDKDSTSWGDTTLNLPAGQTRNIVPTFLGIDERRDIFQFDLDHTIKDTHFGLGLRYENSDEDNSRNIARRPLEPLQRFVTQDEKVTTDLFNVHLFQDTWLKDNLLFTTGYSFTTMDTDIGGSRIYGSDYDPLYDPLFAHRQFHDEGFLNLTGGSRLDQHVANLNFMFNPLDNLTIVPSLRIENQSQNGIANFIETDVNAPPQMIGTQADIANTRQMGFTDVTEGLEARYTGLTNWVFYARGEWLEGDGNLQEREAEAQTGLVARNTDSTRFTQKYSVGGNWYPMRELNLAGQYYHKIHENHYDHLADSTPNLPTSPDRYPAYIRDQDFTTDDVNFRVTFRPLASLSLVSRYDFQLSTVNSRMDLLQPLDSGRITSHIFGESITWTPTSRLFLQGSLNYAIDRGETPAVDIVPNLVQRSDNDYIDGSFTAGVVLTEKTDLQAQYFVYYANNYSDNSRFSVPYNTSAEEHGVSGTIIHKFSRAMQWTLKYGWTTYRDTLYGDRNNYEAHMLYSSFRYRF